MGGREDVIETLQKVEKKTFINSFSNMVLKYTGKKQDDMEYLSLGSLNTYPSTQSLYLISGGPWDHK